MKEDYITSEAKKPEKDEGTLKMWKLKNSLVMSWLLNTITTEIGEDFLYFSSAKEIWKAARETYSNVDNTLAIF